jgi:hypothetical protein
MQRTSHETVRCTAQEAYSTSENFSEQSFLQQAATFSDKQLYSYYFTVSSQAGVFIKKQHTKGRL